MPRGDHTGPMGMGSMTGRGAGYCAGAGMPGFANDMPAFGFGPGFGRGRGQHGRRNRFYATGPQRGMRYGGYDAPYRYPSPYQEPDPKSEKRALNNHAKALQSELDFIEKRLSELEARDE